MKIKVCYKNPNRPKSEPSESFYMYCKRIGAKSMMIPGMIGLGSKIHNLHIDYIELEDGSIDILSIHSYCGSAKWNSHVRPILDTNFNCNCKKCLNI